jgi:hypothetical protein
MELWQMDIVGRFFLADGTELSALTGIDDFSRLCVSARLMPRVTAKPVCEALRLALRTHGLPKAVLSDIQGLHCLIRSGFWPGVVRPDPVGQWRSPPAHGAAFTDDDGQSGALLTADMRKSPSAVSKTP